MNNVFRSVYRFLGSYGLSVTVILLLFVLTLFGTLEQASSSLFEVQRKYFEALIVWVDLGPVPVPLPGVYLLLIVLFVNLVVGGILRMRKSLPTLGVLVIHIGIVVLMLGSLVEFQSSQKGHTTLIETERSDEFQSYYEWELAISEAKDQGPVTEHVISGDRFEDLGTEGRATFASPDLPFEVTLHTVLKNAGVSRAKAGQPGGLPVVDGLVLTPLPLAMEAEQNTIGAYATITDPDTGESVERLLSARMRLPASVEAGGKHWNLILAHRRWQLPFTVVLDEFRHELHPGTGMPKSFESDVTRIQGGASEKIKISMNKPLRHQGYTLYQSGWNQPDSRSGGRFYSTFSVVRNPADDVPLIACLIMTLGLVLHFSRKLVRHVRTENRKKA